MCAAEAKVHCWAKMACDRPMPLIERRRVMGEQVMISHVTWSKGFSVAAHSHANEQMSLVVSGRVRFKVGPSGGEASDERVVEPGEVMHLPPHVPHSAEALEDSVVLDVFSPPSERTGVDRAHG